MVKIRIYLDNCCFNRPYDSQSSMAIRLETEAKLSIQNEVKSGFIELAWSYILDFENNANDNVLKKRLIGEWIHYSAIDVDETESIIKRAEYFSGKGFKENDALHISCAIAAQCKYFITVDKSILNKSSLLSEIIVIDPIDPIDYYRLEED